MRTLLIADTHFNHEKLKTYCDRPDNFTELLIKNWNDRVQGGDTVIHLGDVGIGKKSHITEILLSLWGKKILIRGNHDRDKSCNWWMNNGFDFACDGMQLLNCWISHEPASPAHIPQGCSINIHGHLHNIFHGFFPPEGVEGCDATPTKLHHPWQRLFAVEYTNYCPIEMTEFLNHPDKYNARGVQHGRL